MTDVYLEVTDDTLVSTERGVVKLSTLLHRPVEQSLWAICWGYQGQRNGISFHASHGKAKSFADQQDPQHKSDGPARLVKVSDWLYNYVHEHDFIWTNLATFECAETYEGEKCKH